MALVAVTGGGGRLGTILARGLSGHQLRLVDRELPAEVPSGVQRVQADLTDLDALGAALDGAQVVVHLAADASAQQSPRSALERVAGLTANLVTLAPDLDVQRIVHTSSIHAIGLLVARGEFPIRDDAAAAPCCAYGASKAWDEFVLDQLHLRTGIGGVSLRLGATGWEPNTPFDTSIWLGDRDFVDLVAAGIDSTVARGRYLGFSLGSPQWWDRGPSLEQLGHEPSQHPEPAGGTDHPVDQGSGCLLQHPRFGLLR